MSAALVPRQVEEASRPNPVLQSFHEGVKTGDWNQLQGTPYKALREVLGQLVIRGNRIVMPRETMEKDRQASTRGTPGDGLYEG